MDMRPTRTTECMQRSLNSPSAALPAHMTTAANQMFMPASVLLSKTHNQHGTNRVRAMPPNGTAAAAEVRWVEPGLERLQGVKGRGINRPLAVFVQRHSE